MDQESPGTYYFEVVNKPSYDTQFVYKWKESNTVYNDEGGGYQGFEVEASPYMEFTLSRAYADKPTRTRYGNKSEQSKQLQWLTTFTTHWTYENMSKPIIEWEHDGHEVCLFFCSKTESDFSICTDSRV